MPMDQLQVLFLLTLFCRVVFTRLAGQWPWSCLPALPNAGTVGTPLSTAFMWLLGLKPESWLCGERFPDKALSTSQGWGEGLVSRGPSCDQDQHCWIKVLSPQKRDFYDLPKTNPTLLLIKLPLLKFEGRIREEFPWHRTFEISRFWPLILFGWGKAGGRVTLPVTADAPSLPAKVCAEQVGAIVGLSLRWLTWPFRLGKQQIFRPTLGRITESLSNCRVCKWLFRGH